jgi:hypothetical protein
MNSSLEYWNFEWTYYIVCFIANILFLYSRLAMEKDMHIFLTQVELSNQCLKKRFTSRFSLQIGTTPYNLTPDDAESSRFCIIFDTSTLVQRLEFGMESTKRTVSKVRQVIGIEVSHGLVSSDFSKKTIDHHSGHLSWSSSERIYFISEPKGDYPVSILLTHRHEGGRERERTVH